MIRVNKLLCRLGPRHTLRVDALTLEAGQCWTVYGANGAGKSALAAAICGRLPLGQAHVHYQHGFDAQRDIAVVSFEAQQQLWQRDNRLDMSEYAASAHDPGTTVAELIGATPALDTQHEALITELGLHELLSRGIRFLSSGQMRRALIARALYRRPRLLILDEPLDAIDRDSRERISALIAACCVANTCVLVLSRRLADVLPATTHMAVMEKLQLRVSGSWPALAQMPVFRALTMLPEVPDVQLPPASRLTDLPACVPLIALRGVDVCYGERVVLTALHWQLWPGQHVLIEGPNGCGKSTLLSLINGENHKAYGQPVYLFGQRRGSGETVWQVKSWFGVVSNELHNRYIRGWRVRDVVISGFHDTIGLYAHIGGAQREAAAAWLQAFGLQCLTAEPYHTLSFGQQRLVLLARAMVKQPRILMLDEPAVGLDDYFRALLRRILDAIADSGHTQILYVSHGNEALPACLNRRMRFIMPGGADGPAQLEVGALADAGTRDQAAPCPR